MEFLNGLTMGRRRLSPVTKSHYPWHDPAVDLWLDQESDTLSTMNGLRLTRGTSQHYTAPHISELDGAAAVTFEFWRAEGAESTSNTNETGFMGQGCAFNGGYSGGNGFSLSTYDRNNSGLTLLTNVSNTTYKRAGYDHDGVTSAGTGPMSSHLFIYNGATTPRIFTDGVERTLTVNDTLASTLPSGSSLFRIGNGYRYGGYTWFLGRIWLRALSTAEAAAVVTNRKVPVLYADLEAARTGLSTGVLRNWENGTLQCKVTAGANGLLTGVNSPTGLQTWAWKETCRATGQVFSNIIGRGHRVDTTGVFKSGRTCFENTSYSQAGASYSNAILFGETTPNAWPTAGGILDQFRCSTLPASEAFGYSIYGTGISYTLPGILTISTDKRISLRMSNTDYSPAYNGSHRTDTICTTDTNYTHYWAWDGSTVSCKVNGSAATVTNSFNIGGGANYYPNQQSSQTTHANGFPGNIFRGFRGTTVRFRRTPSARLLAKIDARIR